MAKSVLLILMLASVLYGNSQTKKEKEKVIDDLFYDAEKHVDDSAFAEAVTTYKQIAKLARKKSSDYARAVYNVGYTYYLQRNDSAAEQVFLQILGSDFNEMDRGGKGSGIMQDPYALYKHNACEQLAEIEFNRNNYAKALQYIKTFHLVYPYRHFCGNELAAYHIYTAEMYGRAYAGMKDTASAIKVLLPEVLGTGLAPNVSLVNRAVGLLKAKYEKQYLIDKLNTAIDSLGVKTVKVKRDSYEEYQLNFMGVSIIVWGDMMSGDEYKDKSELEKRKLFVKNSFFYKLINDQPLPMNVYW
jgi:tetratricopeptide (TPR) repeat protein